MTCPKVYTDKRGGTVIMDVNDIRYCRLTEGGHELLGKWKVAEIQLNGNTLRISSRDHRSLFADIEKWISSLDKG